MTDAAILMTAISGLDAWLDTMRGPDGYGGPVAHWWQNCLQFTGAGLDWRYEGILIGYLNLHDRTGEERWLAKARRAGDDLVRGQLPTGNFRNSAFELNPYSGGTPHEAACDLALLRLAQALRDRQDSGWQTCLHAAQGNLMEYYVKFLWDAEARAFRDHPHIPSFVPNKAATLAEALFALARVTGDSMPAEAYALPALDAVLAHQVRGGALDGAICQYSTRERRVAKFFPYYIARCVPGLMAGHAWSDDERYVDAAGRALAFVLRQRDEDGGFPQVVYSGGRVNRYPRWVAAAGDILRAMALLEPFGFDADPQPTLEWLLQGQEPTGAFRTAQGFASQVSQREPGHLPDFRDLLPVCGWADKAFRYLTEALPMPVEVQAGAAVQSLETECTLRGRVVQYGETDEAMEIRRDSDVLYRWRKGAPWADICAPQLQWK